MPAAFSAFSAATPESTVSPATKRAANRRASPLPRINRKMRGCSLSHSRPARSIRDRGPGSGSRGPASGIELRVPLRQVAQRVARCEPRAVAVGEPLELSDDPRRAQIVGVPERASAERRESEAEDRADVPVPRRPNDALARGARRLVQHHEHQALDDLGGPRPTIGLRADHLVDGWVHAALLTARVLIEPLASLAPEPAALDHAGKRRYGSKTLAVRLVHHADHLLADVQSDLVHQRDWADGEPELHHEAVELLDRYAFHQQLPGLVHVGR